MRCNPFFDEHPLVIQPEIAVRVGLNEAIVLQQVNYWLVINEKKNHNFKEGHYWTYNTFKEWQSQFPFWSVRTLKTIVKKLEQSGLLISANFNKMKTDRTKWYRINYDAFTMQSAEVAQSGVQSCTMDSADIAPPLPETNAETTSKTTSEKTRYGDFFNVYLTHDEYMKLEGRFTFKGAQERISELSIAMESKGYKYKSHYATILNWARRDGKNGTYRGEPTKTSLKDSVGKPLGAGPTDWGVGKPLS